MAVLISNQLNKNKLKSFSDVLEAGTFEAGRLVKVHGVNGRIVIRMNQSIGEVIDFPEWLFIRIEGGLVPFAVAEESVFQKDDTHLVVGLDQINTPEQANRLIGNTCNLEGNWSDWFDDHQDEAHAFIGFEVRDEPSGKMGKVVGYQDIPGNPLLEIEMEGKSFLLPLQEEFILLNDTDNQQLVLKIPDGLLSL